LTCTRPFELTKTPPHIVKSKQYKHVCHYLQQENDYMALTVGI